MSTNLAIRVFCLILAVQLVASAPRSDADSRVGCDDWKDDRMSWKEFCGSLLKRDCRLESGRPRCGDCRLGFADFGAATCAVASCPSLNTPENGLPPPDCRLSGAKEGEVCTFACKTGFTLEGQFELICMRKDYKLDWSHPLPTCRAIPATCPSLKSPVNGWLVGSCKSAESKQGEVCGFGCDTGFALEGPEMLTCVREGDGPRWNLPQPFCRVANCPSLNTPENGKPPPDCRLSGAKEGDVCTFLCNTGFALEGPYQLTCTRKDNELYWDHPLPTCKGTRATCPPLKSPVNGWLVGSCQWGESKEGEVCTFACHTGFALEGPENLTCVREKDDVLWNRPQPFCRVATCEDTRDDGSGIWFEFCWKQGNKVCTSDPSSGPVCACKSGCKEDAGGNCVCETDGPKRYFLKGFFSIILERE